MSERRGIPLDDKPGFFRKIRWFWLVPVLVAVIFGLQLHRDLSLEIPLSPSPEGGESHMEIEEINIERFFGGDSWHLKAPLTIREGEDTVMLSADIRVATVSGDRWTLLSPRAHFDETMEKGLLEVPQGAVEGDGYNYRWRAGKANWEGRERIWSLSEGVKVEGKTYVMEARSGTIFPGGQVRLDEEVTVRWRSDIPND